MNNPAPAADNTAAAMRSIIQRIATGPELSKDISLDEARLGMRLVLEGKIDPVQMAIFLIALRMKRETYDENKGILDGIRDLTHTVTAPVDEVLDLADPYDGYNRTLPPAPFLPAVLATCGVATVTHGLETVGPKFGVTHRQILRAAGVPVALSMPEAAARLGTQGWVYVDQADFCPALNRLIDFRTLMVKRSVITTVEVLTGAIRGQKKTHLVTGYVHKPYPPIYAMLARHAGFDSAMMVRGVEGGIVPSLRQAGKFFYYHGIDSQAELGELDFEPAQLDIVQELRAVPLPDTLGGAQDGNGETVPFDNEAVAKAALAVGLGALAGEAGATRDALVYAGAMCLWHLQRVSNPQEGAARIRQVLDNGEALARFQQAQA